MGRVDLYHGQRQRAGHMAGWCTEPGEPGGRPLAVARHRLLLGFTGLGRGDLSGSGRCGRRPNLRRIGRCRRQRGCRERLHHVDSAGLRRARPAPADAIADNPGRACRSHLHAALLGRQHTLALLLPEHEGCPGSAAGHRARRAVNLANASQRGRLYRDRAFVAVEPHPAAA